MLKAGITMQGTLHEQYGIKNQDAIRIFEAAGFTGVIACDGVSLKSDWTFSNSELAAALVSKASQAFLENRLDKNLNPDHVCDQIRDAFLFSLAVLKEALEQAGIPFFDCQTTLIIALYKDGLLYGGIAGDGGILYQTKLHNSGTMITRLKSSSSVYPIGDTEEWRFFMGGSKEDPVVRFLAATDGVFDQLIIPYDGLPAGNYALIDKLFSIENIPEDEQGRWLQEQIEALEGHDDKTVAIIMDTDREAEIKKDESRDLQDRDLKDRGLDLKEPGNTTDREAEPENSDPESPDPECSKKDDSEKENSDQTCTVSKLDSDPENSPAK